ncbi:MAG: hypothetical protein CMN32_03675 [Saprospirales bacterium]|nr:hypothetical protein [Saprospirales bacterium]
MWESQLLNRTEIDDEAWNAFVDLSPQRYLYYYTWYLDAVCPGWQAVQVAHGGETVLQWPLPIKKKGPLPYAYQPRLTQFGGPVFRAFKEQRHRQHHQIKSALQEAIKALPKLVAIDINLHPELSFFMPFQWAGYKVKPRFTYWLPLEAGYADLKNEFSSSIRNHLKKAAKAGLEITKTEDPSQFLSLALRATVYSAAEAETFQAIWKAISGHRQAFILEAHTPDGQLAAAAAFIPDVRNFIFFGNALSPSLRNSGAGSLLIAEGIHIACESCQHEYFDFEGSMLPPVEQYFRAFNPEGVMYLNISRKKLMP